MADLDDLKRDYRVGLLRYLPRGEESALATAYELGRSAVAHGVSVLELARIHHEILVELLEDARSDDATALATAAGSFFLEALATYGMAQREFLGGT